MYLYRVLNKYDEAFDVEKNGIASKKLIDNTMEKYHIQPDYNGLSEDEKLRVISSKQAYILDSARYIMDRINQEYSSLFLNSSSSARFFKNIVSTVNEHLIHGSRVDTKWISFSKEPTAIQEYYCSQEYNKVAVINGNYREIFENFEDDILVAVDFSNKYAIQSNPYISTLANKHIDLNSRVCENAMKSKEVCYYNLVPAKKILSILDALLYELILFGVYNPSQIISMSDYQKQNFRKNLIDYLKIKYANDPISLYIITEHFEKNRSFLSIQNGNRNAYLNDPWGKIFLQLKTDSKALKLIQKCN